MGEPATPTAAERARVLSLAKWIVDSVRNDEEMPTTGFGPTAIDGTLFRFAQDLLDTRAALERACDALSDVDHVGRGIADRLRKLDLEGT
jgi:hypothetical protein